MSLLLAMILLIGGVVGGTVAWLVAQTAPVVNTFTYGDINITLEETDADKDGDPNKNNYEMVPGRVIGKDPKVTVKADSEDSWLFVKLEKSDTFDGFLEYELAEGWNDLEGETGVYFREVANSDADAVFNVLKGDEKNPNGIVTVKDDVTKQMLNELTAYPTLTITAYAVQKENIDTVEEAWAIANPKTTP